MSCPFGMKHMLICMALLDNQSQEKRRGSCSQRLPYAEPRRTGTVKRAPQVCARGLSHLISLNPQIIPFIPPILQIKKRIPRSLPMVTANGDSSSNPSTSKSLMLLLLNIL